MSKIELHRLACLCLSLDCRPEFKSDIITSFQDDNICLDFIRFCRNKLILPTVYLKLKKHEILPFLPVDFVDFLTEVYQLNLTRNESILKQLQQILDILNEKEIYPTLLKGAGNLVDGIYSDVGERMMSDIDFLVSESEYLLSAELLQNAGYRKYVEVSGYQNIMEMKHFPKLYHPDFPGAVEIHRIPVDVNYLNGFNQDLIDAEKRRAKLIGGCYVLSDKHKIAHNFIHCQLSNEGFLFGGLPLRDIYDLYLFSERMPLQDVLPHIKEREKAIAYFALASEVLHINFDFPGKRNFSYKILKNKHDLNLKSQFLYRLYRGSVFIFQRIFIGYIGQFFQLFFSKEIRKSVFKRLSTRKWYKDHLSLYKRFFIK